MIKVIGVRFRQAGKVYYFDPLDMDIKRGDHVIVETARGVEYGNVVMGLKEVEEDKVVLPLKPVIRVATKEDDKKEQENRVKEKDAYKICHEKIRKHGLGMKLIDAEYTFDNNKVLFYFTADGRIDFRDLVKDLASVFKTRIELRQIGVRDETKILGGLGICGRALCCHSYLSEFAPVSIKMAKEQNLSLRDITTIEMLFELVQNNSQLISLFHFTFGSLDQRLHEFGFTESEQLVKYLKEKFDKNIHISPDDMRIKLREYIRKNQ